MLGKSIFMTIVIIILIILAVIIGILYIWPIIKGILITIYNFIRRIIFKILGMRHTHGAFHSTHSSSSGSAERKSGDEEKGEEKAEQFREWEMARQNRLFRRLLDAKKEK